MLSCHCVEFAFIFEFAFFLSLWGHRPLLLQHLVSQPVGRCHFRAGLQAFSPVSPLPASSLTSIANGSTRIECRGRGWKHTGQECQGQMQERSCLWATFFQESKDSGAPGMMKRGTGKACVCVPVCCVSVFRCLEQSNSLF